MPERTLSKNHTAIDDLQDLVSPKNEEVKKGGFEASERVPSAKQNQSEHGGHLQSPALGSGHFSVDYYRAEIKCLTFQLTAEDRKQEDLLFNLSELEKQRNRVLADFKEEKKKCCKLEAQNGELQGLVKTQMVINLELEELIGKMVIKHKQQTEKVPASSDLQAKHEV